MIRRLRACEILDSRGRPTVEVAIELSDGTRAVASVPSGESKGRHEAIELRDADPRRYRGQGVRTAVANVNEIVAPQLIAADPFDQAAIDARLIEIDGTSNKSRLGSNATLAVSIAVARAAALSRDVPLWRHLGGDRAGVLPLPMVNMISGGLHARGHLDFQDFLVVPLSAGSWSEALAVCVDMHASLGDVLAERGLSTLRADEGGYGPLLPGNEKALDLLHEAAARAGHKPGADIGFALDVAATHFYDAPTGLYHLTADARILDAAAVIELLERWVDAHPIVSIEDGLAEDDWEGWRTLTDRLGDRIQIVGDDLFTTNLERLEYGIEHHSANAVLVKMNQIGTLTEAQAVAARAQAAGFRVVVSARSGETEDTALADLAVALNAGQIKVGSVTQSERLAKYNRLLRIEEELGESAHYAGREALDPPEPKEW
jgi:enolase 1/2/3